MNQTNYIGADLSKLEVVIDLSAEAKPRTFPQTQAGYTQLLAVLPAGAHVVCEASGGYERAFVEALEVAGISVSVVMPRRVRAFAVARGLRAKTDPIDARLLSAFGHALQPRPHVVREAAASEWQALVRARQSLVAQLNQEASQAEHCTVPLLQTQAQTRCALLQTQVQALEARLRATLAHSRELRARAERMQEVCGIGEVNAWTLLAEMPELGSLQPGQPAAMLGVAPDPHDSGPRYGRRHIGGGRGCARRVLYMAALTAAHRNHVLSAFYRRLTEQQHKPKLVALTAVMRKLIELLNRLLADPHFVLAG